MSTLKFKRGDTFLLTCIFKVDDVASSVSAFTIKAQLRNGAGNLVKELAVTKDAIETGKFTLRCEATETQDWALALHKCDIQFTQSGTVNSSNTFYVEVVEDITK